MKNEKAFLNGMWEMVAKEEKLEMEKNMARQKHKKIMIKNIVTYFSIIILLTVIIVSLVLLKDPSKFIVNISMVSLLLGYIFDKFLLDENNFERTKYYE